MNKQLMIYLIVYFVFLNFIPVHAENIDIELKQGTPHTNESFEATNIYPGDSISQEYRITVHHEQPIILYLETITTEETKNLADVLKVEIIDMASNRVIYDGNFKSLNKREITQTLSGSPTHQSIVHTKITVSMEHSIGNEVQDAVLKADFNWFIIEEEKLIKVPNTGDSFDGLLWTSLAVGSLFLILLLRQKRKEESTDEAE